MLKSESTEKMLFQFGKAYSTRAGALAGLEDFDGALDYLARGIGILEDLVTQTGNTKAEMNIIYNQLNRSMLLINLQRFSEAIENLDQAKHRVCRMIDDDDRVEMRFWLATILMKQGRVYHRMENTQKALTFLDQSIELFENLIDQEGKHDLSRDLYFGYAEKAEILEKMGDNQQALVFMDRIVDILTRFDDLYQQVDFNVERAHYIVKRALIKNSLGIREGIETDLQMAIPVLKTVATTPSDKHASTHQVYLASLEAAEQFLQGC